MQATERQVAIVVAVVTLLAVLAGLAGLALIGGLTAPTAAAGHDEAVQASRAGYLHNTSPDGESAKRA